MFKIGDKVQVVGTKARLTITGETFNCTNEISGEAVIYWHVKERGYAIPESKLKIYKL